MKILINNKKIYYNYEILEEFQAGLELYGPEVKSILKGNCSIAESYIDIKNNEAWLKQCHVLRFEMSKGFEKDLSEIRDRRLLLHKNEINKLSRKKQEKGLSIVPLNIHYSKSKKIKIQVALCRGKKTFDKRHVLKDRQIKRDTEREIKSYK
jgi:SsrA-binding protein